ncbi:MAG: phosphomannomutase/phosphoglucomutase [Oscillospiraceae bacterium]|jgi:phosphomannomutase|nr:phosphomannomutase/phosphoglucomutase [Oscillospiraceae bacterium]
MPENQYLKLKSGTDIRGVACEGAQGEPVNLTDEVILAISGAFARWLIKNAAQKGSGALTVSVGHDSRLSAGRIKMCVIKGLTDAGINVLDCGLSATPAMFMTTVDLKCDGAVQITASHHPWNRNGLKFFTPAGGLDGKDITAILNLCESPAPLARISGTGSPVDYMSQYSARLRDMICREVNAPDYAHPLAGFNLVVDAGNGAGGFYAEKVLKPLGADTTGSLFLEPDGRFPNHIPNPEDEIAMGFIRRATVENGADLGIIFDTDVDRAGCVDSSGMDLNKNRLIALASAIALDGKPGTIVTDSITSAGLREFIEGELGGTHHRFRRGYRNVINEALRLNAEGINCPLAIETSGHAALRENYFLDDGAYLITKIIIFMARLRQEGKNLQNALEKLKMPAEEKELRFNISGEDFSAYGLQILADLTEFVKNQSGFTLAPDNYEGVRASNGNGWFLLRMSVHDPVIPLNMESDLPGGIAPIEDLMTGFLNKYSRIYR